MLTEEISSFVHFGNKEFDISSKFMKVSIFLHLLGDFSPVCMQSVYPRCTCAVPSACKNGAAPPDCPQGENEYLCLSPLTLTDNWFDLFFCRQFAIESVYSLQTSKFNSNFIEDTHLLQGGRKRIRNKQRKTQNNLQITHLHKGSIAAGPYGATEEKLAQLCRRFVSVEMMLFADCDTLHIHLYICTVTRHSSGLARQLLQTSGLCCSVAAHDAAASCHDCMPHWVSAYGFSCSVNRHCTLRHSTL